MIVFILFIIVSVLLIAEPENFLRNIFSKKIYIQITGFASLLYNGLMLYSFVILLFRKNEALTTSDCHLIDNSRFESMGKICFGEIIKVEKIGKSSLKIVLKKSAFESRRLSILKKIALTANNWDYKNSIIVSSSLLLDCDRDDLKRAISAAKRQYKPHNCLEMESPG